MSDNQIQPGAVRTRAYLFDGGLLCALICAVGLAWWFDLAVARESTSRPTLFAHHHSTADKALEFPAPVVANDVRDAAEIPAPLPDETPEAQEPVAVVAGEPQAASPEGEIQVASPAPASLNVVAQAPAPVREMVRAPPKPEHKVEFFEVESHADSVAFVVDCSGSMSGTRFERARQELANAINQLAPDQTFYVVFFNEGAVRLFPGEHPQMVVAGSSEKDRILEQVKRLGASGGTNPEASLELAIGLDPDSIYLLSDGIFGPPKSELLETLKRRQIKVQTIAFEDSKGHQLLKDIAAETGGTFCYVPPGRNQPLVQTQPTTPESPAAAVLRAGRLRLDTPDVYLSALAADDPEAASAARAGLMNLAAHDIDYGPPPGADADARADAIAGWRRWFACRPLAGDREHWPIDRLASTAISSDPRERLAALMVMVGKRRLRLPDELMPMMPGQEELIADLAALSPSENAELRFANGRYLFDILIEILDSGDDGSRKAAERALGVMAARRPPRDGSPRRGCCQCVEGLVARGAGYPRAIEREFPGTKSAREAHDLAETIEPSLDQ